MCIRLQSRSVPMAPHINQNSFSTNTVKANSSCLLDSIFKPSSKSVTHKIMNYRTSCLLKVCPLTSSNCFCFDLRCRLGCSPFPSIKMAISSQFPLYFRNSEPKFQINQTKKNFAKSLKQKSVAECCQLAKFGGAQARQGRALATLFFVRLI